ncbi:DNA-binding transcriptional regulator, IclR family [Prauserella marina]|uniref:DNA-binding transcriptional regulator, IclR family n=1 Tax=Prauserella marina TaxID=530584 RepID=A0A1G6KKJ0_9PSEU|nr:IclR family transcriptional regulator [Prauserella marina]PWV84058.1 IclR family transcriptional regulator [Prauserella marina]SDC31483.1 DNA-binding transcriptional regulator, IclR family [Prauserella marina]
MERKTDPYRVEAVDRALILLSLLAERGDLSVTEAGKALGVAPSTAHRLLSTLCHRGFAVHDDRRRYGLGPSAAALTVAWRSPPLPDRVRPHLEYLFAQVSETVHLMVLTGSDVRFADGIESARPLRVGLRTGARMPAYCTSGGKAMLADLTPEQVEALHPDGLTPWPVERIHDLGALHTELREVRGKRFGLNHDESEPDVTAIGASIGIIGGEHAALTVALPSTRFAVSDTEHIAAVLLAACRDVRGALGAADVPD